MSAPKNRAAIASSAPPADTLLNADEIVYCRLACCDSASAEAAILRELALLLGLVVISRLLVGKLLRSSGANNSATSVGAASQHEMPHGITKSG